MDGCGHWVDPVIRLVEENPRVGKEIHGWRAPIVLWSLDLASEFFHDLFRS